MYCVLWQVLVKCSTSSGQISLKLWLNMLGSQGLEPDAKEMVRIERSAQWLTLNREVATFEPKPEQFSVSRDLEMATFFMMRYVDLENLFQGHYTDKIYRHACAEKSEKTVPQHAAGCLSTAFYCMTAVKLLVLPQLLPRSKMRNFCKIVSNKIWVGVFLQ